VQTYSDFVEEHDIDYEKVLGNGGRNHGDEDFAVFGCPFCKRIYLLEYEVDTVFTDACDLTKRISVFNTGFTCVSCGKEIEGGVAWIGRKAKSKFRVRYEDIQVRLGMDSQEAPMKKTPNQAVEGNRRQSARIGLTACDGSSPRDFETLFRRCPHRRRSGD